MMFIFHNHGLIISGSGQGTMPQRICTATNPSSIVIRQRAVSVGEGVILRIISILNLKRSKPFKEGRPQK